MQIMSRYRELDRQLVTHQTWVRRFWQKRQIHTSTVSGIVANNVVLVSAHRMCIVWAFTQFELLLAVSSRSTSTRCTARTQYRRLPILHGCENRSIWRHSTCSSRLYAPSVRLQGRVAYASLVSRWASPRENSTQLMSTMEEISLQSHSSVVKDGDHTTRTEPLQLDDAMDSRQETSLTTIKGAASQVAMSQWKKIFITVATLLAFAFLKAGISMISPFYPIVVSCMISGMYWDLVTTALAYLVAGNHGTAMYSRSHLL